MAFITDPDRLDRFQVAIDPVYKTISLRGSGTFRVKASTASGTSEGQIIDSTEDLSAASVTAGDIIAIVSDPDNNKGVIGHYKVTELVGTSGLKLDRSVTQTGGSGLSYEIYSPGTQGGTPESLADGVTLQALYSFLKEEWRVNSLDDGTNNSGEDLIKYTFPMVSITSEQFELGGVSNDNWEFSDDSGDGSLADESPRNLIRTGGWASINKSGEIVENYPSIVTLGTLDPAAQVYYQLTSATTTPIDFVLTGAVNQSIRTLETIGGVTTTGDKRPVSGVNQSITFTASSNTIDAGSTDLFALGFASGELVQVRKSSSNNGLFTITSSGAGATTLQVSPSPADEVGVTCLLSPLTDNRDYLVLRVRTKGKTYAQSEIADIGVSQINTIVNRFPLSHIDDPAITLADGQLGGDGTSATTGIQTVETFLNGTDGTTSTLAADGTFEFNAVDTPQGALFDTSGVILPGDTLELVDGNDIGFFEIKTIDASGKLTAFSEPLSTIYSSFTGGDSALTYNIKTPVLDSGSLVGDFDYTETAGFSAEGTITDASRAFTTNGAIGNREVQAGDMVVVSAADGGNEHAIGVYKVNSVAATVLTVDTTDLRGQGDLSSAVVTYRAVEPGMHLQYKKVDSVEIDASANNFTYSGATITLASDVWAANDYYVGSVITLANTSNDGTYIITDITGAVATVINVTGTSPTFSGGPDSSGTINGEYGFIRELSGVSYSFNWRLFGNNASLSECFQFLQRELRRATDIDESNGTSRGDITDLLMSFVAPNATTLNLFIDDADSGELNNLTQQDSTGNNRNFPFLVTLRISSNANITNAEFKKIVVFFSDSDGTPGNDDEFGTPGAEIVPTSVGGQMVAENASVTPIVDFTYNYTGEGDTDRPITVVCITTDTGQYVQATSTLVEENIVPVSLVAGLERNYSNPDG